MIEDYVKTIFKKNKPLGYALGAIIVIATLIGILENLDSLKQYWFHIIFIIGVLGVLSVGWDKDGTYTYGTRKIVRFLSLIYVYVVMIFIWTVLENRLSNLANFIKWGFMVVVIISMILFFIYERAKLRTEKFDILFFEFSEGKKKEIPSDRSISHSVREGIRRRFNGTKVVVIPSPEVIIDKEEAVVRGKNANVAAVVYCDFSKRQTKIKLDLGFEVIKKPENYQPIDLGTKSIPMEEFDTGHLEILIENDYANVINFLIGLSEYSSGNFKAAIKTFTSLLAEANKMPNFGSLKPENLLLHLGNFYYSLRDMDKSRKCFDDALDYNLSNSKALHNIGVIEYQAGNLEKAKDAFSKALSIDDKLFVAYRNRAFILIEQDQPRQALEDLSKCLELKPLDTECLIFSAICYGRLGIHYEAVKRFEQIHKSNRRDINVIVDLKNEYVEVENYFKAFLLLVSQLYKLKYYSLILGELGDMFRKLKYMRFAELLYTIALHFDRKKYDIYFSRSYVRSQLGKLLSARKDLENVIRIEPNILDAYIKLGDIHMRQNNFALAVECFSNGISLFPNFSKFYIPRAQAYALLQKFDEAIRDCEDYIRLTNANKVKIYKLLALVFGMTATFDKAIDNLDTNFQSSPSENNKSNLINTRFAYVTYLLDINGNPTEIARHYKLGIELDPLARLDDEHEGKLRKSL